MGGGEGVGCLCIIYVKISCGLRLKLTLSVFVFFLPPSTRQPLFHQMGFLDDQLIDCSVSSASSDCDGKHFLKFQILYNSTHVQTHAKFDLIDRFLPRVKLVKLAA